MPDVPSNLIPTRVTELTEYQGSSPVGYMPYILEGRTYKLALDDAVGIAKASVNYTASDPGAVTRSLVARASDVVYGGDYGVTMDGTTDDTAALENAIKALRNRSSLYSGYGSGMGLLLLPEGVCRITENGILNEIDEIKRSGLTIAGTNMWSTHLWLDPSALGDETWFYDNGATSRLWGLVLQDLSLCGGTTWERMDQTTGAGFGSTNLDVKCNGLKISGPGWESGFILNRVGFRWLEQVMYLDGSNNADTHRLIACDSLNCNKFIYVDNLQAFSLNLFGCYISGQYGNFLEYGPNSTGGGGNFLMQGGAIIAQVATGDTDVHHVVTVTEGGPSVGNAPITFSDVRFELRGNYHGFANSTSGSGIITARGCSILGTGTVDKNLVTVGGYTTVRFDNTSISAGTGGGRFKYVIGAAGDGMRGKNGHLIFCNESQINNSILTTDTTWVGNGGRLTIDDTCIDTVTYVAPSSDPETRAIACDVFGPKTASGSNTAVGGGLAVSTTHRTRTSREISPFTSASQLVGSAGLTGTLVRVPLYSRLKSAWVRIEAGEGNGNNIRCLIGSDDKLTVYGSTTVGAQNAGQFLRVDLEEKFVAATDDGDIRFWFDDGAGGNTTASSSGRCDGGVEYI